MIGADLQAMPRVTVAGIIAEAGRTTSANLLPLAKIAVFPLLLWLLLPRIWLLLSPFSTGVLDWICSFWPGANAVWTFFGLTAINFLCTATPLLLFCSHWLQFLLRPRGSDRVVLFWCRHDARFLRYGFLLFTLQGLFSLAEQTLHYLTYVWPGFLSAVVGLGVLPFALGAIVVVLFDAWVVGRSAPVFAAAAAGRRVTLREAWAVTQGQNRRLMLLVILLLRIPLLIGVLLQGQIVGIGLSLTHNPYLLWLIGLPSGLVNCLALALVAVLSCRLYLESRAEVPDALLERFE